MSSEAPSRFDWFMRVVVPIGVMVVTTLCLMVSLGFGEWVLTGIFLLILIANGVYLSRACRRSWEDCRELVPLLTIELVINMLIVLGAGSLAWATFPHGAMV